MKHHTPVEEKGLFITFEGIEGSGKSRHIKQLFEELEKEGYPVILTREPGGTRIGEKLRNLVLEPDHKEIDPTTELLLYLAARSQHLHELILPALRKNKIILCDRFHDSTYAYQGGGRGIDFGLIDPIIQTLFHQIKPDLTFLLDLPPNQALERVRERTGRLNRIDAENIAFHETVRSKYLMLVNKEPERFRVVNSSGEYAEVHQEIRKEIALLFRHFRHEI
ncbi:MAG: dTMP kinase [Nitrospirae bacterium]|nr:dTMP kinase [Nitrospirota bacterium]MBI3594760.1 dTMP kinase [Nitrospirota bacterium]